MFKKVMKNGPIRISFTQKAQNQKLISGFIGDVHLINYIEVLTNTYNTCTCKQDDAILQIWRISDK